MQHNRCRGKERPGGCSAPPPDGPVATVRAVALLREEARVSSACVASVCPKDADPSSTGERVVPDPFLLVLLGSASVTVKNNQT